MTWIEFVLVGLAAVAAGAVNALAGGGTLISFPVLVAVGVPAVAANVTNSVALAPGYLSGALAQFKDLNNQRGRLLWAVPAGAIGGIIGGLLLLNTGERLFRELVPFLILLAAGLLAVQDPLRAWLLRSSCAEPAGSAALTRRAGQADGSAALERIAWLPVGIAAIYGGYFGAGLSVIVLAVLGLVLEDTLTRLNALKQAISFSVHVAATVFFVFSGQVVWAAALVMAVGALAGGALGGRLAGRVKPATLRWIVVSISVVVGIYYLVR